MSEFSFDGPYGYENWRACNAGFEKSGDGGEAFVYSDSRFSGELVTELGPYQLVNAICESPVGTLATVFALRLEDHLPKQVAQELPNKLLMQGKTSLERYHGGGMYDEVTALLSLAHGVRLQAGPLTRMFGLGNDPRGRPMTPDAAPPILLPHRGPPVLPRMARDVAITASQLPSYPRLSPADALALARAARSYQEAVWVADSDPQLAWLLLVSAVETAAVRWFSATNAPSGTDSELLRAGKPELADLLEERGGPELLATVAVHIAQAMRAGHKFRTFLTTFVPMPPIPRPNDWAALDWSPEGLKKVLRAPFKTRVGS